MDSNRFDGETPFSFHSRDGWEEFGTAEAPVIAGIIPTSAADWKLLPVRRRDELTLLREAYNTWPRVLPTVELAKAERDLKRLMLMNRSGFDTGHGLAISGPHGVGKTTTAVTVARKPFKALRAKHPDGYIVDEHGDRALHTPVALVKIKDRVGERAVAAKTLRFYGGPRRSGLRTTEDWIEAIEDEVRATRTRLLIIDDAQNLTGKGGKSVADFIKDLMDSLPITVLMTGENLTVSSLFTGGGGGQISKRFDVIEIKPVALYGKDRKINGRWLKLINEAEKGIQLFDYTPGTLATLAVYLHDRTAGTPAALGAFVRKAAGAAILDGREDLDEKYLDSVLAPEGFEQHNAQVIKIRDAERDAAEAADDGGPSDSVAV